MRYYGIEQEFGNTFEYDRSKTIDASTIGFKSGAQLDSEMTTAVLRLSGITFDIDSQSGIADDAARYYIDHGHLERSATEAPTIKEAVANVIAGQMLMSDMTGEFQHENFNGPVKVTYDTMVADTVDQTWGFHENYLMSRNIALSDDDFYLLLGSAQVARYFYSAGFVDADGEYIRSQKIRGMSLDEDLLYGDGTITENRPLSNTRDEPLVTNGRMSDYRRHHGIGHDSVRIPDALVMRMALMDAMISMIEQKVDVRHLALADPVASAHLVGRDHPHNDTIVEQGEDYEIRISDHITAIAQTALDHAQLSEEVELLLRRIVDQMGRYQEDPESLKDEIDCFALQDLISQREERLDRTLSPSEKMDMILKWHSLDKDVSIVDKARRAGRYCSDILGCIPRAEGMKQGQFIEPASGRAQQRAEFRARSKEQGYVDPRTLWQEGRRYEYDPSQGKQVEVIEEFSISFDAAA